MLISLLENYRMAGLFMPGARHSSKHTQKRPVSEAEPPAPQQVLLPAAKTAGDESARALGPRSWGRAEHAEVLSLELEHPES